MWIRGIWGRRIGCLVSCCSEFYCSLSSFLISFSTPLLSCCLVSLVLAEPSDEERKKRLVSFWPLLQWRRRTLLTQHVYRKCNSALSHPQGVLILPTVVNYSRVLSRLAIGLDKQPHLIASLAPNSSSPNNDTGTRETLPERAANILRQAFVTCLNDRSGSASGLTRSGAPDGKKRGIYTIANLCLKILFACRKTRGAAQIFENIYNQSPPLSAYPKSERVTYLYYLGRFLWANGHFYRALLALQQAYNDCHPQALQQRRLILIYLMASNIVCARFPAEALYARPEARGLRERFEPLCQAIRRGDVYAFRRHLDDGSEHYRWFSFYRLDVQLRNRCEPFVWRSLVRKTFILSGDPGNPERRVAPTVDLNHVLTLLRWMEIRYRTPPGASQPQVYIDPDFQGLPGIDAMSERALGLPTMMSVMSKMSSLINQDFLNGYLSYGRHKLAIQGARQKGALAAGFPVMWKVIEARGGEEVPGWKKEQKVVPQAGGAFGGGMRAGPGMVVNLSGARPVGSFG